MVNSFEEFCNELLKSGFSMGSGNAKGIYAIIPFNWTSSMPDCPIAWHTGDPETDPWEWRMRVLEERDDIAYGKVFFGTSGYITKEWYPYFLAVRRQGLTFDECSGGKVIQKIVADTGAKIDIEEDGMIYISAVNRDNAYAAKEIIEGIVFEPEVGAIYTGKVTRIIPIGAFVEFAPGKEGLVHISKLDYKRVEKVEDVCEVGDTMTVKYLGTDEKGRLNLSRRDTLPRPEGMTDSDVPQRPRRAPQNRDGHRDGNRQGGGRPYYAERKQPARSNNAPTHEKPVVNAEQKAEVKTEVKPEPKAEEEKKGLFSSLFKKKD